MRIGQMRDRVVIQRPTNVPDEFGGWAQVWTTFATVWARVETTGGTEADLANGITATLQSRVTIRTLPGLLPTYRVKFGTRFLSINAILNDEARTYSALLCVETVPALDEGAPDILVTEGGGTLS